jgi:hypothetical protein
MDFEVVFFHCSDYHKLDPRILDIIRNDEDVVIKIDRYTGISPDTLQRRLNPDNIEEKDSVFTIKNPDNTFTTRKWETLKKKNNLKRNTPQTEEILRSMKLFPIRNIKKLTSSEEVIWNSDYRKAHHACDFMVYMIDTTKGKIAGVAKAKIIDPQKNLDDFPKNNPDIPLDKEYIYISEVDIHPNYIGKRLCKPFLKEFMNKITKLYPKYTNFYIENASNTGEGIPACICYVRSGEEEGYEMFYFTHRTNTVGAMNTNECIFSTENPFDLPRSYFYIKPSMSGSGKKKKTKRKRNKKTKNKKRGKNKKSKKKI